MKIIKWRNLTGSPSFREIETWMFENVGFGGPWLKDNYPNPNGQPILEENDEWGCWVDSGELYYGILDKHKAVWFLLRWS